MSSSKEKVAGTYLWGLAITLIVALGSVILLSWIVDPLGILREDRGLSMLCADGIKTNNDRASIPLLPLKADFSQAIIGTSRIKRGFTQRAFEKSSLGKAVNLGINSLNLNELHRLSMPLIRSERLDTLWAGLDFGMFSMLKPAKMELYEISPESNNRWQSYLASTLSFTAWRETTHVLLRFHNCRTPIRDYSGFIIKGRYWNKRDKDWNQKQNRPGPAVEQQGRRLLANFSKIDTTQPARYQYHLTLLEQLIKEASDHSVQLHLFINPSPSGYFDTLERAGKMDEYRQWQLDIQALIQNAHHKAMPPKFRDFSDWYSHEDSMPPGCHDSFSPTCPFYDFTHYRPHIGQQIVKEFQD
jgi:hypothetical protein